MAAEHGMIEPFEPNQIKHANGHKHCFLWDLQLWL